MNYRFKIHTPLSTHIRILIAEKRRARALYQRTRLPYYKQEYNNLYNSLKRILSKNKALSFENYLSNLSTTDGSLWKATKHSPQYKASSTPIKKPDDSFASSDFEKAELFKNHLYDIFQPHPDIFSFVNMNTVQIYLNSPLPVSLNYLHVSLFTYILVLNELYYY